MEIDRVLDRHEVCNLLGISENTFYSQAKSKGFPQGYRWGEKTDPRWLYSEVVDFIKKQNGESAE